MSRSMSVEEVRGILSEAGMKPELISGLQPGSSLIDAGVDSLEMANALLIIEERYGVKIPDEEALQLDSIEAIAELVGRKLS